MPGMPSRLIAAILLSLAGCGSPPPDTWLALEVDSLGDGEAAQLAAANGAREELFGNLMGRLSAGMETGGATVAIDICKEVAPAIASEVAENAGVTIGRTSVRLRNPENKPPAWAVPYMELRGEKPVVLRHTGDGTLAALFPIVLQAQCLPCHGPEDSILPEVRNAIQAAYPDDRATGFNEGDLRGWFHVTVPAGKSVLSP